MGYKNDAWVPLHLMRCMSKVEFVRYKNGETLRNLSTHQGWKTDSIGFCFFPVGHACERIEDRLHYLSGIVSFDVVAVFATKPGVWLTRSYGYYRDTSCDVDKLEVVNSPLVKKTEFCTTVYDKDMLNLVGWGRPYWLTGHGWWIQWLKGKGRIESMGG